MINITQPIPRNVTIAFSGGVDSIAVADFLRNNHNLSLLYIDHHDQARTKEINIVLLLLNEILNVLFWIQVITLHQTLILGFQHNLLH